MGRISGATIRAQIPLLKMVIRNPEKLPTDTPSKSPVTAKANRVRTEAKVIRKISVRALPCTWLLPNPKYANA
jgi:hypothetical protein